MVNVHATVAQLVGHGRQNKEQVMKAMKIVALLAQLVLSFHGEGHPPHDEHNNDRKGIHSTAR